MKYSDTKSNTKRKPGTVRDAIIETLAYRTRGATVAEIAEGVSQRIGPTAASSVRSYLRLNTPKLFTKIDRGHYVVREEAQATLAFANGVEGKSFRRLEIAATTPEREAFRFGNATLIHGDCFDWLAKAPTNSVEAVVTDPPYGLVEYSEQEQDKLRKGRGGVWRIPPSFDGNKRAPLPRFTVLSREDIGELERFFFAWARLLLPVIVPGGHVLIASNPLLSFVVANAVTRAGFERRGEIIRLTMTMRGGDRPKAAHTEFTDVSVMPRSMWEPWLIFRKPIEGRVQDNLRRWKTGGFRRPSKDQPFGDVIASAPTRKQERALAPHPSLKPQAFVRKIVRAVLPLGEGTVLDTFAGAGSTLAAAEALGYASIGIEKDQRYFDTARTAIPKLRAMKIN
ncbi:MAG TPA: DNA methyltransferase [Chthoniobacterales bacterium]|nr:DNA methyltransferase [Chthoniobacterales bacterium]